LDLSRFADALRPSSLPAERVEGWGDWRIRAAGVVIAFSLEDPGIHVMVEGELPPPVADQIVDEILQNVERVTGQQGRVVPI